MALFPRSKYRNSDSWIQRHSLSLVLFALLIIQTAHALWAGHRVWLDEAASHLQPAVGWPADFWIWWSWEYNTSLVADTFGVILIVLLSKWLHEEGSAESNK